MSVGCACKTGPLHTVRLRDDMSEACGPLPIGLVAVLTDVLFTLAFVMQLSPLALHAAIMCHGDGKSDCGNGMTVQLRMILWKIWW